MQGARRELRGRRKHPTAQSSKRVYRSIQYPHTVFLSYHQLTLLIVRTVHSVTMLPRVVRTGRSICTRGEIFCELENQTGCSGLDKTRKCVVGVSRNKKKHIMSDIEICIAVTRRPCSRPSWLESSFRGGDGSGARMAVLRTAMMNGRIGRRWYRPMGETFFAG